MIRMKKTLGVLKIALKVSWWAACVMVALLIIMIIGAKIQGKVPYIFGYTAVNIVSGSMEDTIPTGSYILIKKTDADEIKKGDIICFYSDDPSIKGRLNTHTVVEDPIIGENGIEFVTKGKANPDKDAYTAKGDKLVGKYITNMDWLTQFTKMLEGNGMFILLITLTALCAVFMIVPTFMKAAAKENEKEDSDEPQDSEA